MMLEDGRDARAGGKAHAQARGFPMVKRPSGGITAILSPAFSRGPPS